MLEANAAAIGRQTVEIGEMQNNPVIALESVKKAHNSLIEAMDKMEEIRAVGTEKARAGIAELNKMSAALGAEGRGAASGSRSSAGRNSPGRRRQNWRRRRSSRHRRTESLSHARKGAGAQPDGCASGSEFSAGLSKDFDRQALTSRLCWRSDYDKAFSEDRRLTWQPSSIPPGANAMTSSSRRSVKCRSRLHPGERHKYSI